MTTKQELEARQTALQNELDSLKKTIEAMPPDDGKWVPKDGETYWTLDSSLGSVTYCVWIGDTIDRNNLAMGLAFRTEEDAEHALEVIKQTNFAPYPEKGTKMEVEWSGGNNGPARWQHSGVYWTGTDWQKGKWHCNQLRVKDGGPGGGM